jgi:hypothetical protein
MGRTNRITKTLIVAGALFTLWACSGKGDGSQNVSDAQRAVDTLTRRQKDSLISTMPVPGAGAVGRALDAQDATRARAAALDSILNH